MTRIKMLKNWINFALNPERDYNEFYTELYKYRFKRIYTKLFQCYKSYCNDLGISLDKDIEFKVLSNQKDIFTKLNIL